MPDQEFVNLIGMKFVLIQPGTFMMGSDKGKDDEKPVHKVTLSAPFYLGVYPVTQAQYEYFNASRKTVILGTFGSSGSASRKPAVRVSYEDALKYCDWLTRRSLRAGELREGEIYRLPTEAEWEYCCRAGTTTAYSFGEEIRPDQANFEGVASHEFTDISPVGSFPPNSWGLYDLHGNVAEWVADVYGPYSTEPQLDPAGPAMGEEYVVRGGSFLNHAANCTSASRWHYLPEERRSNVGFRLVRTII